MWGRRRGVKLVDTLEMEVLFAKLDRLNPAQLMAMRATWGAISREKHEDAWATVRAVGVRYSLTKEIDRVRDKAMACAARGLPLVPPLYQALGSWSGYARDLQQTKMEAGEAIVDTALGMALGDRLDAHTHDILMAPWLRVTEGER
jgi:hypothetical protein